MPGFGMQIGAYNGRLAEAGSDVSLGLAMTLRLLSHELRTPVGVLQGYLRMLSENRIEPSAKARILDQMQQAASRIAAIGQQASDIARWIDPSATAPAGATAMPVSKLLAQALAQANLGERIQLPADPDNPAMIATSDADALVAAFTAVLTAASRETAGRLRVATRAADAAREILVGPDEDTALDQAPGPDAAEASPADANQGGLGLSLVLALTVVSAHGGQVWQLPSRSAFFGVRLLEAR